MKLILLKVFFFGISIATTPHIGEQAMPVSYKALHFAQSF